jgi:thiamine-phosphate pyrophosphorylase
VKAPAWICLVTDRRRLAGSAAGADDRLIDLVREAAASGVDLIQVREPDLEAAALAALVERCLRAADGSPARIVVNDRVDVAIATGAAGVHLPAGSMPADRVRAIVPASFLIGRSVHEPREAAAVVAAGAIDYLVFGTVFESASKPGRAPAGVDRLREAVASAGAVPVLGIGGVTTHNAALVASAGAAGLAAIGAFLPAGTRGPMREVVAHLRAAFDAHGSAQ